MKFRLVLIVIILFTISSCAQSSNDSKKERIKVAFLIYPEIAVLDYTGPLDAFVKANRMSENQYEVFTVSEDTTLIETQGHVLTTKADYTFNNSPQADILIIPGAKIEVVEAIAKNPKYASFIKQFSSNAQVTMSVCTGSFILGELGMLDGHKATTHWVYDKKFKERFPKSEFIRDVRYVDEGNLITTSGVTAGIDGAIHLIERFSGKDFAGMIERGLQHKTSVTEKWPVMPKKPMNHDDSEPIDN